MTHAPVTRPRTLTSALTAHVEAQPDALAFAFLPDGLQESERVTWSELLVRAQAVAAVLRERVPTGDRAILLLPAGLDQVVATQACFLAGVVGVTVAPPTPRRRDRDLGTIDRIARDCGATAVLLTAELGDLLVEHRTAAPRLAELPRIAVAEAAAVASGEPWWEPPAPDALAYLQYTSGSTSAPRGVMLSHRVLVEHTAHINDVMWPTPGSVDRPSGYSWLPPWHDMGLIGGIFTGLLAGAPTYLAPPHAIGRRPMAWLEAISALRIARSGGPDFIFRRCADRATDEQVEALDLSAWECAFCGAEPVRATTVEAFRRRFEPAGLPPTAFDASYGLAEAALVVSSHGPTGGQTRVAPFDRAALARGTARPAAADGAAATLLVDCGTPADDHAVAVVDPQTSCRVPDGEVGEFWVAAPTLAAGYWGRPEETAETFGAKVHGEPGRSWLRTGDLGFRHEGRLFVAGRSKDVLIAAGVNHHAVDVEFVTTESHAVLRGRPATAFAVTDPATGEERMAIVVELPAAEPEDAAAGDVLAAVRRAVAAAFDVAPLRVVLTSAGSIPKTTSGKVQRAACRAALEAGELPVVRQWMTPERSA